MKRNTNKTYSVLEAAKLVKCSRAIVSRLCQHGLIGTKHELPDGAGHCYRLGSADIAALRARKKRWESRISKKAR